MSTKAQTRAPRYILFKSFFLAIGWRYRHDLSHTFLKRLKRPNIKIVYFFTVFLTIKTSSQNISITLLQISLKLLRTSRRLLEERAPVNDFGRTVPSAKKYCAASKTGNGVILLIWQLRCHPNSNHNKFSSLSNTTVVAIIPNLYLWRRSLCCNLGGIDAP